MKKSSIKNVSLVWGAALLISGCIWIVAQSNANDETAITIDTNRYTATQHIQEVHLNDKSSSTRVWLKNEDSLVLGVGEVGADERVGKLKNSVGGEASVIGGRDNKNWWSESSLIVGGESNLLAYGKLGSVVMGGKSNQVNSSETVVLASKEANTQGSGVVAVAVNGGQVLGDNSLFFAGDHSYVKKNDSMVIGSAVMMDGAWSFAFNAKREGIIVDTDHSFIVNADHGLIVGTNKNNGTGVSLTVNGAVRVWEAKGFAKDDDKQEGAIFRVACSSPAGASCLCVNVEWQIKSMSSNPACDAVCGGDKSASCTANDLCGTRAITYAAAETGRRANTTFCALGSHKSGPGGSALLVGSTNFPKMWEIVKWHCTSDFGGGTYQCLATRKQQSKETAKCGSYHGMNFMAASLTNWPAGWTFCEKGVPTPTVPAFPKTGKPVSWTCGGENLNTVPCSANGCNRCSKEGFPYCFPVDLDPSCHTAPVQPVNGVCAQNVTVPVDGTKLVGYAQANSSLFCSPGTLINPPVILNGKLEWKCAWLNGWEPSQTCTVPCPSGYSLQNGACVKVVEQKNCSVEIKDLSCKEARGKNGWWVDRSLSYTYTWKDCRFSAIYDSWTPTEKWNLVASHNSPSGDSHIVNSNGSITATRKLNNDQIGPWYWPSTHTFYVDMWGNTSSKKSFSMYGYAEKCRNALPKPPVKIDRNGKPFEWEVRTIYESDRTKVGKILYMKKDCSGTLANRAWFYANCYKYVDSKWTPISLETHITPMDEWWIIDRKNRELQLEPNHTYYMPCESNQRCSFEVDSWWYKIKNVKQYQLWILWKY